MQNVKLGTFFKEQLWNTIRFLIGMVLILSLIEAQLQMKSTHKCHLDVVNMTKF